MSWNEAFQTAAAVIASLGGSVVIIGVFSSYFGKIWANKYLESIKKENEKEIEKYKSHLDTKAKSDLEVIKNEHLKQIEAYKHKLDMIKENSLRYSGEQFQLYNELWNSLYELKLEADSLWNVANTANLRNFAKQLKNTKIKVEKSSLFIEDNHYFRLKELLDHFSKYQFGKKILIEIYNMQDVQSISPNDINELISINGNLKNEYEQLIENIRNDLKKQIKGVE